MRLLNIGTFLVWIAVLAVTELTELHIDNDTKPVIYGQELSFVCSSNVTDTSSWYWFLNNNILFSSGLPGKDVDIHKYKENRVTENIRHLTISDFEFSDIQNYTCLHAFEGAWLDLTSEAYNFVFLDNSTSIETRLQGNLIIVDLFNVSPVPSCSISVKSSNIPMKEHNISKDVYLYNVSFQLNVQCNNGDIITNVQCDVGGLNLYKSVNINCPFSDDKTNPQTLAIAVTTTTALIAVVIVISVTVQRTRKLLLSGGQEKDSDADNTTNAEPLLDKNISSINIQS
ncbi:unnamed protein product [Mytilus coruscus]|uniref:Ig-like domain-containing protein n=1 Tax=Mytilus coruscus TaxID=42192 RepID=A0A6J8DQC0_MYTCO|nr:unnamed protein product [Mytilus coruscus]